MSNALLFFCPDPPDVKLLECSSNQLSDIPASLSGMVSLQQLYLRHNKLCRLPPLPGTTLKVRNFRLFMLHLFIGVVSSAEGNAAISSSFCKKT